MRKNLIRIVYKKLMDKKLRLILTIVNLSLGVFIFTFITTITININQFMTENISRNDFYKQISIFKISGTRPIVLDDDHLKIIEDDRVVEYRISYESSSYIIEIDGIDAEEFRIPVTSVIGNLVFKSDEKGLPKGETPFISGREMIHDHEIVIAEILLHYLNVTADEVINRTATIQQDNTLKTYTIVGVIHQDIVNHYDKQFYSLAYKRNDNLEAKPNNIMLAVKEFDDISPMIDRLKEQGLSYADKYRAAIQLLASTRLVTLGLFILSVFIYILFSLSLRTTLHISLKEKIKFLGLLKAVGYTNKDSKNFIILESLFIGLFAWLCGFIITLIIFVYLRNLNVSILYIAANRIFSFHILSFFVSFIINFLLSILFSLKPAREIQNIDPIDALVS